MRNTRMGAPMNAPKKPAMKGQVKKAADIAMMKKMMMKKGMKGCK